MASCNTYLYKVHAIEKALAIHLDCQGVFISINGEFYCLSFFSNSILTPIVAQTMRSMICIDKPLFSLPINIAINSNIRETEYKMIIALFFIIKLSVD